MIEYAKEMTDKMSKKEKEVYGDYDGKMQAESDANTLMEYGKIQRDEKRRNAALHCIDQKLKDLKAAKSGESDE